MRVSEGERTARNAGSSAPQSRRWESAADPAAPGGVHATDTGIADRDARTRGRDSDGSATRRPTDTAASRQTGAADNPYF